MAAETPTPASIPVQSQPTIIEAEDDAYADSTYGDGGGNSTSSISSSILKYREENGRTYHAYKEGSYMFPNDEAENDREDLQHHLFSLTLGNKLHAAEIPPTKVLHRVLDIGTGTGIWAIDFADEHPESSVIGVDLSPIQPTMVPPNCKFEVDDVEQDWAYSEKFDFIHSRMMMGALDNIPRFIDQAFANLTPGGILEMSSVTWPAKLNDGEWPKNSAHKLWMESISEALAKIGRKAECAREYKDQMIAAGFVNVVERVYIWPCNRWPKDARLKELGMWELENTEKGLEAISLGLFTRVLGWTALEVQMFILKVRAEFRDTTIHAYYEVIVVTGEKPE